MAATYRHILRITGLLGSVQALYVLLAVVRGKVTALLIGAAGMGLADLYMRTIDLVGNATNFGIAFSAVRRLAEFRDRGDGRAQRHYVRLVRSWTLLTALLGTLSCLLCSPLLSRLLTGEASDWPAFAGIAPAVGLTTIATGELAVLKGMGRLKRVAAVSAFGALGTLLTAVPLYLLLGLKGVVPVIVASAMVMAALCLRASTRLFPYRVSLRRRRFLRQGGHLLRLGMAYVVAGIFGSGAEAAIRAGLMQSAGGEEAVGLYAAGFVVTVSYARLIFTAMDADYFPRLSVAVARRDDMNECVNRQTDVLTLLVVPFLILFALFLPYIVRLLYTEEFLAIVPMVLCALAYMFFKAVFSPAAYLPLASGHSRIYMCMELAYDIPFVLLVTAGYRLGGLAGAGIALSLSNAWNLLLVVTVYSRRYGLRYHRATVVRAALQGGCLALGVVAASLDPPFLKYGMGFAAFALSVAMAWRLLSADSSLRPFLRRHHPDRP